MRCIDDPADDVAYGATTVLGRMRLDATTSIPALTHALQSENPMVRAAAAQSLAMFQATAIPAVPALLTRLVDTNGYVRREAEAALRIIAPHVLTNAPPQ